MISKDQIDIIASRCVKDGLATKAMVMTAITEALALSSKVEQVSDSKRDAMEDAAKICDAVAFTTDYPASNVAMRCASEIRAAAVSPQPINHTGEVK